MASSSSSSTTATTASATASDHHHPPQHNQDTHIHTPTIQEVLSTKSHLYQASQLRLPLELIDAIIDFAEYWPCTSVSRVLVPQKHVAVVSGSEGRRRVMCAGRSGREREKEKDCLILRSLPLGYPDLNCTSSSGIFSNPNYKRQYLSKPAEPISAEMLGDTAFARKLTSSTSKILDQWTQKSHPRGRYPCRKIVFTIKSHDQGWGGGHNHRGTYVGSYTWFDVGLERFNILPFDECVEEWDREEKDDFSKSGDDELARTKEEEEEGERKEKKKKEEEEEGKEEKKKREAEEAQKYSKREWLRSTRTFRCDDHVYEFDSSSFPPPTPLQPVSYNLVTLLPEVIPSPVFSLHCFSPMTPSTHPYQIQNPPLPHPHRLQANKTATATTEEYVITWSATDAVDPDSAEGAELENRGRGAATMNGEFVRRLRTGDVVTLWARARFPGWENIVEECSMDVYWAL